MKKLSCITLSLLLFLFAGCSKKQPAADRTIAGTLATEQLQLRGLTEQIADYLGENVAAYKRADGKTVIYLYSAPIERTNNAIEQISVNSYTADGNYFTKEFPESFSAAQGIQIGDAIHFIHIFPSGTQAYPGERLKQTNVFGQELPAVKYPNVFGKKQDLVCYPTSFGVNTEIVIPDRTAARSFQMKIQLPNLVPDTGSPDYILFKTAIERGSVNSILYTPLLCDSKGKYSYANTAELIEKDSQTGTYTIEYTVDEAFLQDRSTKYPVTLNQSIHLYKPKQPDTSAYEKTGDEAGHYLSPYMLLGDHTIKGEGWTFVRYETLSTLNIEPERVESAKYVFRNLFDLKKDTKVGAYAVTADWCSINTRWYNRPPFDEKPVAETIVRDRGDYELDLTPLIKEILKNKGIENAKYSVQNSFMVRSDTKDSNMVLASGDSGLFSPLLEIILSE